MSAIGANTPIQAHAPEALIMWTFSSQLPLLSNKCNLSSLPKFSPTGRQKPPYKYAGSRFHGGYNNGWNLPSASDSVCFLQK
ncbi:hypothetical protein AVEN_149145-1 [Araneus ventricosus]|uniref:Uncharacterized protein n=1 Tax=Araneus ventricosus TaxID=182803 RepID=A0A4Y2V673_ARAVE|nr:hypothetical protein AVEN_228868-1 [Araneus ventricosus]GBO18807.1 hypothetical protein AVEN_232723-1 [Araneus ventricosus]GBO20040.1 hypothetical protein AVEN_135078-1 [Araneus ventricosus]GBO20041.1 hypothetical protein AVEN_149145-1 [Araneus ventricosus]